MSLRDTKKLVVVGGLLSVSVFSSLTSCSSVLSAVPAEKLQEPVRSMVLDAKAKRAQLLKEYSVGSAQMLLAQAIVVEALGYEDEALELKEAAEVIKQSSSTGLEGAYDKGMKISAKCSKLLTKSDNQGSLSQSVYNKHFSLRSTARSKQFNLLITKAIPEIVVLTKAAEGASTMEKAAIVAQADLYLAVIKDFKKIDQIEEAVDAKAKEWGLAVKTRENYTAKIAAAVEKSVPKPKLSIPGF